MKDLNVSVSDQVKADELFGRLNEALRKAGIGGTLHLTDIENGNKIVSVAWDLAKTTGQPVIIVVRAPKGV